MTGPHLHFRFSGLLAIAGLILSLCSFARAVEIKAQPAQTVSQSAAKIDELVLSALSGAGQKPNPPATDEQFVRRVFIDIAGRIPSAQETLSFLSDKNADKRARLIDHLIGSDGYDSQMFNWLGEMLRVMDKQGKRAKSYVYEEWLKEQISKNKPWDVVVREMLTAEGRTTTSGPVGYLLRDQKMPLDSLSNTLTVFLGANIACAQCHDHPLSKWTQREFYEMAAFFGATETEDKEAQKISKKLVKVDGLDKGLVLRLIEPNTDAVEDLRKNSMQFPKDYKYKDVKPGDPVKPKLFEWKTGDAQTAPYAIDTSKPAQLRQEFAKWLTHRDNPRFATAIANRLWKRIFGLAVQEPVTDLDELKGSNPELLTYLTSEMKRVNFDLRQFQRILFNTKTYQQQASLTPDLDKGPYLFAGPLLRRMSAEQTWDSVLTLVIGKDLDAFKLHREDEIRRMNIPSTELTHEAMATFVKNWKATGHSMPRKKEGAGKNDIEDYDGVIPPHFEGMTLARASELPQPSLESHFLRMFGQSDRQISDDSSREGGVPQVLMMMNGKVQSVIASADSRVLKDAAKQKTREQQIESLYISFFSRRPSRDEMTATTRALGVDLKLSDLTWVLFNTREFIFVQ